MSQWLDLPWAFKRHFKDAIHLHKEITMVLKDFYFNEVICITYYKNHKVIQSLISENKIVLEGTLFSKPEYNYLNYMLNDREFDNGPALRNKYSHGNNSQDSCEHQNDYFQLLKIFVLVIIKINEEFCLRADIWKNIET